MCERLVQSRTKHDYVRALGWHLPALLDDYSDRVPHWNVPPGSQPWLLHRFGHGSPQIDMLNWGYRPAWANRIDGPSASSIRLDHARSGPYFKTMFRNGRAIVPADGWYEWSRTASARQPWFVRDKSGQPMFMAAVCNYRAQPAQIDDTGFVLVCDTAPGSIIDSHGMRPILLSAAQARIWLDNTVSVDSAYALAQACCGSTVDLEWHQVGPAVDRRGSNGSHLILPLHTYISA